MKRVTWENRNNFNKQKLGGCDFDVLPFLRIFPPQKLGGYENKLVIHVGWLIWTVIIYVWGKEESHYFDYNEVHGGQND